MNFLRRRYSTTHRHTLNYGDKVMIATGMNLGFRVILIMALVACLTTVCAVGTKEASANPGTVDLVIDADPDTSGIQDTITVENGAQFTVVIWVQPQDGQEVSVVEARVDFDASYLSVDETSYNNFQNILPHANTLFNNPLWRTMDNTNGYADYTDGTALGGTNPTTDFPMFYIKFNADDITSASGTQVTFHSEIPRKTDAFLAGLAKTGSPTGITVKVMEGPIVDFTMDPSNGNITAGNSVSFTATTTSGGPVESWAWDFNNDGTVDSTAANPTWNYGNVAGSYTVKLTGTNTLGSDSETKENAITVSPNTASKLAYNPAPATSVTAGDTWTTFKVEIRDQYDNLTTSTADVTATPSTGAFASGTTNKAAVAGVATFSDLTYTTAGTITVTASSGSLTSAATGNIMVNPGSSSVATGVGGGGGSPGITNVTESITKTGRFLEDITVESGDGGVGLNIPKDTIGKNRVGQALHSITIKEKAAPSAPPADHQIIGLVYDFGPNGATFDPPISLTFIYDESQIKAGAAEENLVIATWDDGKWVELDDSTVDPDANNITAPVSHFTIFTVIAHTAPATFEISAFDLSPAVVNPDESVTIIATITNTGDLAGSHEVTLMINESVTDAEEVILASHASQQVTFTVKPHNAGSYKVDVNGLSATFIVREPPAKPEEEQPTPYEEIATPSETQSTEAQPTLPKATIEPSITRPTVPELPAGPLAEPQPLQFRLWLIIGIAVGVLVIGTIIWQLVIRRRAS